MGAAIGLVVGLMSLMLMDVLEGGSPAAFLIPSPIIMIFGGTFGAAMASFGMAEFKRFPKLFSLTLKGRKSDAGAMRSQLIGFAEPLVRQGAKALFLKGQDVEAELTEATKYWNIKPHLHSSRTGGHGWIVELDRIERRTSSATAGGIRA